jgi:hypothetical protein
MLFPVFFRPIIGSKRRRTGRPSNRHRTAQVPAISLMRQSPPMPLVFPCLFFFGPWLYMGFGLRRLPSTESHLARSQD